MPNAPQTEELLTGDELAAALKVHPETVARWARAGRIPFISLPSGRGGNPERRFELSAVKNALAVDVVGGEA